MKQLDSDLGKITTPTKSKILFKKILIIFSLAILSVVVFAFFALVTISSQLAKGGPFSFLTEKIEIEKIKPFGFFAKRHDQILRDSVVGVLGNNSDFIKKIGGREIATKAHIEWIGDQLVPVSMNFVFKDKIAFSSDGEKFKANLDFVLKVSSGFLVNLTAYEFNLELLSPRKDLLYTKLHLPENVKELLPAFKEYSDKYYYFDPSEFIAQLSNSERKGKTVKLPNISKEQVGRSQKEFEEALLPDLKKLLDNTISDLIKNSTLKVLPREKVAGKSALVYQLEADPKKIKKQGRDFVIEILALLKYHKEDFIKFCEATSHPDPYSPDCDEQFFDFEESYDHAIKSDEDSIAGLFEDLSLDNVKFYVNPVDGSLVKVEFSISFTTNEDFLSRGKLGLSFVVEELSRGKDIEVNEIKDAKNLSEELEK